MLYGMKWCIQKEKKQYYYRFYYIRRNTISSSATSLFYYYFCLVSFDTTSVCYVSFDVRNRKTNI